MSEDASRPEISPQGGRIETVVTYLEMTTPPERAATPPPCPHLEVRRAHAPMLSFYRYLYDAVGREWTWTERKLLADEQLRAIIEHPEVEVNVLWRAGTPAGYVELDCRRFPEAQIAYFGLVPAFVGRGLGRYLLDWAIFDAWRRGPRRLWVHTCDLDHPRALPLYRSLGFRPYRTRREPVVSPPDARQSGQPS